jgi:hypothetical protein
MKNNGSSNVAGNEGAENSHINGTYPVIIPGKKEEMNSIDTKTTAVLLRLHRQASGTGPEQRVSRITTA